MLSVPQLRSELREHLGVDSSDLDDPSADNLLNRSFWEIADEVRFREKEKSTVVQTVKGTAAYTVPTDLLGLQSCAIEDINTQQHTPLSPIAVEDYESTYINNSNNYGKPSHYFRRNNQLVLWQTPDTVYSITVYYWMTLGDIATSGIVVPEVWTDPILFGAIWRGFARLGDYNRSQLALSQAERIRARIKPTEDKEKFDRRYAGVSVTRRPM